MILNMIQHGILLEKNLNFSSKAGYIWQTVNLPRLFQKRIVSKTNRKTILKNNFGQGAGGFK